MRTDRKQRLRPHADPHQRGPHLRGRLEGSGTDLEQPLHPDLGSKHDAQAPVVRIPGLRGEARRHLPLQHQVQVEDRRRVRQQPEQQRRGDVVRQVAGDAQPPAALTRQGGEVELQRVRIVQHAARRVEALTQQRHEIAIDLDGIERAGLAREQLAGERTVSGSDLHQVLAGAGVKRAHDAGDHRRVVQEMLAEALTARRLARSRDAGHQRRCTARRLAMRTAAARLRQSAWPVPARSSAVP